MSTAVADVSGRSIADLVSLAGKRAVVTGAAWGLGKAAAQRLAEAGASVLIGDIDESAAATTAEELSARYGSKALSVHMDASDSASIISAADLAVAELGGIDIWITMPAFHPTSRFSI